MVSSSRSIGEFLVDRKVLARDELERLLGEEHERGVPLAKLLAASGTVAERDLLAAVAHGMGLRFWDPQVHELLPMIAGMLPQALAERRRAVAVGIEGDGLLVAMEDPTDADARAELAEATGWRIVALLAAGSDLAAAFAESYGVRPAPAAPASDAAGVDGATAPPTHLHALLAEMVALGASDLHLSADLPPCVRVDGVLRTMPGYDPLTRSEIRELVYGVLTQRQREKFEAALELDASLAVPDAGRFRLNVFLQRDAVGAVMRAIPHTIVRLEKLGIPPVVGDLAKLPRGLVLVTGPTGSGKSTTLASVIDLINTTRPLHIMTVEDPIEFLHSHKRAVVNQREVGEDTHSFAEALKHVLRQDPDVILVGEMRDLETIATALTAAETGHLVFGTLHTQDAPQAVDRVIDVFPAHQQQQIRVQLASALQAVVTQQLLPRAGGRGRVAACEVLVVTPAVRNLVREGKIHQVYSAMQAGGQYGMQTMDQALAELVRRSEVSLEVALERCHHEDDLRRLVAGAR